MSGHVGPHKDAPGSVRKQRESKGNTEKPSLVFSVGRNGCGSVSSLGMARLNNFGGLRV